MLKQKPARDLIREIRVEMVRQDVSRKTLSRRTNLHLNTVSRVLNGRFRSECPASLIKIVNFLKIDPYD